MNEIRVRRSIKMLRQVPDDRFDMRLWGWIPSGLPRYPSILTETKLRATCGTTACALGWIASTPEANAEGLSLTLTMGGQYGISYHKPEDVGVESVCHIGYEAALAYFEFKVYRTAELLFSPDSYPDADDEFYSNSKAISVTEVADRMADLLEKGERDWLLNYG